MLTSFRKLQYNQALATIKPRLCRAFVESISYSTARQYPIRSCGESSVVTLVVVEQVTIDIEWS